MPWSTPTHISKVIEIVLRENPASIIDVGCGMGVYGFLCRIFLEQVNLFDLKEKRINRRIWNRKIDCIEGFEEYINPVHLWAYNRIIVRNIEEALAEMDANSYDLALFLDVIEHFEKEKGFNVLKDLKRVAKKVLITTPREFFPQVCDG